MYNFYLKCSVLLNELLLLIWSGKKKFFQLAGPHQNTSYPTFSKVYGKLRSCEHLARDLLREAEVSEGSQHWSSISFKWNPPLLLDWDTEKQRNGRETLRLMQRCLHTFLIKTFLSPVPRIRGRLVDSSCWFECTCGVTMPSPLLKIPPVLWGQNQPTSWFHMEIRINSTF